MRGAEPLQIWGKRCWAAAVAHAKVLRQETAWCDQETEGTPVQPGQGEILLDLGFYSVCTGSPQRALIRTGQWREVKVHNRESWGLPPLVLFSFTRSLKTLHFLSLEP